VQGIGNREQETGKREVEFVLSHTSTMKLWMNGARGFRIRIRKAFEGSAGAHPSQNKKKAKDRAPGDGAIHHFWAGRCVYST